MKSLCLSLMLLVLIWIVIETTCIQSSFATSDRSNMPGIFFKLDPMPVVSAASKQDNNTLLYLSFDNTLNGAEGEVPTQASGVTFQPGISGGAAHFPVGSQLQYSTQNNINFKEGTFEVWVKPNWGGADG